MPRRRCARVDDAKLCAGSRFPSSAWPDRPAEGACEHHACCEDGEDSLLHEQCSSNSRNQRTSEPCCLREHGRAYGHEPLAGQGADGEAERKFAAGYKRDVNDMEANIPGLPDAGDRVNLTYIDQFNDGTVGVAFGAA